MGTLVNSEDQDEISQNAAFHPGLHFFAHIKIIFRDTTKS